MKAKAIPVLALVAAAFFVLGRTTVGTTTQLKQKTLDDLSTAMHGEAFAYAKYLLYAQHARHSGNTGLAALFQKTANIERFQHFAEEAQLARLVGSDTENLKDAIKGESYEVETMYADFARQAVAAGDKAAADRFEEVRKDEMAHRDAFQAALRTLEPKLNGN